MINTYPEMNERIIDIMKIDNDNPVNLYAAEHIRELQEQRDELLAAAELIESHCRKEGEDDIEFFERIADMFYKETGFLAPGKSEPMGCISDPEKRRQEWDRFNYEPIKAIRRAIAKAKGDIDNA